MICYDQSCQIQSCHEDQNYNYNSSVIEICSNKMQGLVFILEYFRVMTFSFKIHSFNFTSFAFKNS